MPRLDIARLLGYWPAAILALLAIGIGLAGLNASLFLAAHEAARALPAAVWRLVSVFGDWQTILTLTLALSWRYPAQAPGMMAACASGILLAIVLKAGFAVPRPPLVLPAGKVILLDGLPKNGSFPSGHAMAATTLAVMIWHGAGKSAALGGMLALGAGLVMLSRLAIGVHWPLDVLAGAALGYAVSRWAMMANKSAVCLLGRLEWVQTAALLALAAGLARWALRPALHEEYWVRMSIGAIVLLAGASRWRRRRA